KNRLHTEDGKESGRDGRSTDGLGTFAAAYIETAKSIRNHLFERAVLALPVQVIRRRDGEQVHTGEALRGRDVPDLHDAGGVLVGQRAKEHRVHDGEDRGVGPYPERQDDDGGQGEPRVAQQDANAVAKVCNQFRHKVTPLTASNEISGDTNLKTNNQPRCFQRVPWSAVPDTALLDCAEFAPLQGRYIVESQGRPNTGHRTARNRQAIGSGFVPDTRFSVTAKAIRTDGHRRKQKSGSRQALPREEPCRGRD